MDKPITPISKDDLLRSALSALRDLDSGHSWREMKVNVPEMLAQAHALGVDVEE